jgi:hypothetical protein
VSTTGSKTINTGTRDNMSRWKIILPEREHLTSLWQLTTLRCSGEVEEFHYECILKRNKKDEGLVCDDAGII